MLNNDEVKMKRVDDFMSKSRQKIGNFWNQSNNNPYISHKKVIKSVLGKATERKSLKNFYKNQTHNEMY